jgi:glyoxylate utilization-related uncharacterized protein
MKLKKENIPVTMEATDNVMRGQPGWGGMTASFNEIPAGTDVTPLLEGLKNDLCQVPHWGYIMQGKMQVKYDNGREEVLQAGDVFYLPPGHTVIVEEDVKFIEFSPEKEHTELMDHISRKMAEMEG